MYKIAIFASGSGSNALKIIEHFAHSELAQVSLVVTNKEKAGVLEHAKNHGIPARYFPYQDWKQRPEIIHETLLNAEIDFIALAGFLLKVPDVLVDTYDHRMLNIHPALLPKYGGKGMYGHHVHAAVKSNQETESGITIHWVNENYDEGNIVFQQHVGLDLTDSAQEIQSKVLALEHAYFPQVIEQELLKLNSRNS